MHRPLTTPSTIVNAMTIDVEDYYHVTGFESVIHLCRLGSLREPGGAQHPSPP